MTLAALAEHRKLAKMAVDETGMGIYEDKITKIFLLLNMYISRYKKI